MKTARACHGPHTSAKRDAGAGLIGGPLVYAAFLAVGMLVLYDAVVRLEEPFLRQAFGESYEQYCREVHRWWPRLSRPPISRETELAPSSADFVSRPV